MNINELSIGDTVVVEPGTFAKKYTFEIVTKITKTQIVTNRGRYNRRTGFRVGTTTNTYDHTDLAKMGNELMAVADAKKYNSEHDRLHRHDNLGNYLSSVPKADWLLLPETKLEEIWQELKDAKMQHKN